MATFIWVNIEPGNGLFPDVIKPLTEPMLTQHQLGFCGILLGANITESAEDVSS